MTKRSRCVYCQSSIVLWQSNLFNHYCSAPLASVPLLYEKWWLLGNNKCLVSSISRKWHTCAVLSRILLIIDVRWLKKLCNFYNKPWHEGRGRARGSIRWLKLTTPFDSHRGTSNKALMCFIARCYKGFGNRSIHLSSGACTVCVCPLMLLINYWLDFRPNLTQSTW